MAKPTDYIDVAERLVEFRAQHPNGSLQQVSVQFLDFAGKSWVVYTAAAYRTPDDERPGHGTAWEPVPGPTNFTRDSELQNAETSAWGRALVAVLAADTKRGVASANEVRNRSSAGREGEARPVEDPTAHANALDQVEVLLDTCEAVGLDVDRVKAQGFAKGSLAAAQKTVANLTKRLEDAEEAA
jgi:hypothetical protein